MFTNRREFLKSSSLLSFGAGVPAFLGRTAHAATPLGQPGAKDTVLVVVQLTGGNDGLNTVVPHADPEYAKLRPTLKVAKDRVLKVTDAVGLHPSLTGLHGLLQDNALCVVQGVGYPNPTQSHFRSMDIWHTASTAAELPSEGWLGNAIKATPAPAFHLAADDEGAPLAVSGAPVRVPSLKSLDDFQVKTAAASGAERAGQRAVLDAAARGGTGGGDLLDFVRRTAANTYAASDRLKEVGRGYQPKAPYPATALANKLKLAAQLIDAGTGARLFYVTLDGFDTHAGQAGPHARLLEQVSGAVTAFVKDVSARGHRDRVLVMTFSEFGRRPRENGSAGTDHGTAAPMFLAGGRVKPGLVGDHPSLTDLADANLKHSVDFRSVYAAVLEKWLGVPAKPVLGGDFAPAAVFAG